MLNIKYFLTLKRLGYNLNNRAPEFNHMKNNRELILSKARLQT